MLNAGYFLLVALPASPCQAFCHVLYELVAAVQACMLKGRPMVTVS